MIMLVRRLFSTKATFGGDSSAVYERIFKLGSPVWSSFVDLAVKGCPHSVETPRQILDVASGPGEPGLSIARRMPDAQVTITDVEESMMKLAQIRCSGVDNVKCEVASAIHLSQFADNSFDLVTCNFGLMFFPDQVGALREMKRVLRPGCELLISHWHEMALPRLSKRILAACEIDQALPADPESLAKVGATEDLLSAAGFDVAEAVQRTLPFTFTHADNAYEAATLIIRTILADNHAEEKARRFFDESIIISADDSKGSDSSTFLLQNKDDNTLTLHPTSSYIITVAIKPPF
uniref:Methyltransferase type 11 domain-containing protein n=1 Tax=Aureoumbra lagunensis TaxID=44058 RepID=A0A7S3JYH7_9STRA|mmetsp:Transcript_16693/g.25086  ORF Transcript_16693/g.25086 Transcript_16693/m.25086 type:complete len:293 (+) Transcript_16693:51-929(+)